MSLSNFWHALCRNFDVSVNFFQKGQCCVYNQFHTPICLNNIISDVAWRCRHILACAYREGELADTEFTGKFGFIYSVGVSSLPWRRIVPQITSCIMSSRGPQSWASHRSLEGSYWLLTTKVIQGNTWCLGKGSREDCNNATPEVYRFSPSDKCLS